MNPIEIQLLGLIGLRALAETDSIEFTRSTDLSKRELDLKIRKLLPLVENRECKELYDRITNATDLGETPVEVSFTLQQVYASTAAKAQFEALMWTHSNPVGSAQELMPEAEVAFGSKRGSQANEHEELLRLSAMLLLRYLRDYSCIFHQRLGRFQIDAVLEPASSDDPHVVIEIAPVLRMPEQLSRGISHLKSAMRLFGPRTLGLVITEQLRIVEIGSYAKDRCFILEFDSKSNSFGQGDLERFLSASHNFNRG